MKKTHQHTLFSFVACFAVSLGTFDNLSCASKDHAPSETNQNYERSVASNNDVGLEQQLLLNNTRCSKAELHVDKKPTINFFSSAVGEKYEDLLPMYAFFAL